jgi:hypothetical protein
MKADVWLPLQRSSPTLRIARIALLSCAFSFAAGAVATSPPPVPDAKKYAHEPALNASNLYHVYIGVAAEFAALWLLLRLFIAPRLRRTPSTDV